MFLPPPMSFDFRILATSMKWQKDIDETIAFKGGVRARFNGNASPKSLQRFLSYSRIIVIAIYRYLKEKEKEEKKNANLDR